MPSAPSNPDPAPGATRVRLDTFDASAGLDRGRSKLVELAWYLTKMVFFLSAFPWPQGLKRALLRAFGAKIGAGVVLKPRLNIHFPWKLSVGDHAWLGEEAWILNFEPVTIGAHVCISQRAFLCAGNHDFRATDFRYRNAPIRIEDGAWIGAGTFIAPGVTLAREAVATAGSVVVSNLPAAMICSGNPCTPRKPRWGA